MRTASGMKWVMLDVSTHHEGDTSRVFLPLADVKTTVQDMVVDYVNRHPCNIIRATYHVVESITPQETIVFPSRV